MVFCRSQHTYMPRVGTINGAETINEFLKRREFHCVDNINCFYKLTLLVDHCRSNCDSTKNILTNNNSVIHHLCRLISYHQYCKHFISIYKFESETGQLLLLQHLYIIMFLMDLRVRETVKIIKKRLSQFKTFRNLLLNK